MADLKGTYRSPNGSPYFDYDVNYSQTGRTGSSATYRVNLRIRMTSSYSSYGYGMTAYVKINGKTVEKRIKNPSPTWSGSGWQGTWSFDVTASAGTGGGTLPAEVKVWGTDGGSAPNMTISGKTVSLSTWNTAPTWTSDDGNVNGWKQNKIIPENTGVVHVYPPKATDKEGNKINYDAWRYVNDQNTAKVCQNGNVNGFDDNISAYGQGAKIKYQFRVDDGALYSDHRWSWTYTKNKLTPANISVGSGIKFDTTEISVTFNGQSNTDGNTNFTFGLSSPNITIHNGNVNGNTTIKIHKSGTAPTTPYINFEDLKNLFRSSNWQGNITINAETRNAYGSKSSKSTNVSVDLRTNPNTAGTPNAGGQVTVAGGSYFIPARNAISLNWSAGSDKLGGAVTYDVQGAVSGGQWTTLKSGLTTTSTSINLEAVTKATNYVIKIITRTNFGYSTESGSRTIELHYYNQPKIVVQNTNRSANEFSCDILTTPDTSISAVAINMRQYQDKNGNWQNFAGSPYRMKITGLSETDSLTRQIKCSDNSGLSNNTVVLSYNISSYVPIVSIRKKGLGVNTLADDVNKFKVNGRARAYAFVSEGYETNNSGGDNVNKWVKVASFRVTGRYEDASATIDFLDSGSGSNNPVSGRLRCRLKQQNDFTQNSSLGLILENPINCSADDFYMVVTRNVVGEVISELWYRCSMSYTYVYFYPSQTLGQVTMYSKQPFQNGIPGGQNKKAEYSPRETLSGMGAMGTTNKNGYWGLMAPDGNDGNWTRTTANGIIPYQSGGASSLGTSSWPFTAIYGNTIYENGQSLNSRYIPKTGGDVDGRLNLGDSNHRLTMGVGSTDAAIGNTKSGKWLQLRDDGDLTYSGEKILRNAQSSPLWQGYHHMAKSESVTPSKKLSQCNNGWVIVWSDWNDGGKGENFNFVYSYVPKNTPWKSGQNHTFPLSAGEGDKGYTCKTLYIYDDKFTGHDTNKQGSAYDIVVRAVLEY